MASTYPIWPSTVPVIPMTHTLEVSAFVNSFGGRFEQRIVNDLPASRSDGTNTVRTHVGTHLFKVQYENVRWSMSNRSENALLNDGFKAAWQFYQDCFWDNSNQKMIWSPFYFYNKAENDVLSTWIGDDAATPSGTNSRGETCYKDSGRYLVRFATPSMSAEQFTYCLFKFGLDLIEVAE